MKKHEKLFLLTDGCMWDTNKKAGTFHTHAIEIVDLETGAVRYIRSGSVITFNKGFISETRDQGTYNKASSEKMSSDRKDKHDRKRSKK